MGWGVFLHGLGDRDGKGIFGNCILVLGAWVGYLLVGARDTRDMNGTLQKESWRSSGNPAVMPRKGYKSSAFISNGYHRAEGKFVRLLIENKSIADLGPIHNKAQTLLRTDTIPSLLLRLCGILFLLVLALL